jgi:predicted RNase H-like HicB family nuclease
MKPYQIIIEPTQTGFSAYSPDVPGCVSTGRTRDEVEANMQEALDFHLEGLQLAHLPIPRPGKRVVD